MTEEDPQLFKTMVAIIPVQGDAEVLVADIDRMAMCRVMEHRMRILAQLTIICNPTLVKIHPRSAGRKRKPMWRCLLRSSLLEFFLSNRCFSGFRQSGQTRPCHTARSPCAKFVATRRERASRGPDQIWRMSRILDGPRMRSYCAIDLIASTCTWGPSEDVSRPRIATKSVDGDRHQLVLAKSASWSLEPGVTDQRAVELDPGQWCVA